MNRTGTHAVDEDTPHEVSTGLKPNLLKIPEWGALVWVCIEAARKLDARAMKAHWVDYTAAQKGNHIYWPAKHKEALNKMLSSYKTHPSSVGLRPRG